MNIKYLSSDWGSSARCHRRGPGHERKSFRGSRLFTGFRVSKRGRLGQSHWARPSGGGFYSFRQRLCSQRI